MKSSLKRIIGYLIFSLALSACTTFVSVEKVNPKKDTANGYRYNLPQPFILVTPKPDGGVTVEELLLPDPERQYAVNATTLLGTSTLKITTANNLLSEVTANQDGAAVASKFAESFANVEKAKIESDAKIATKKLEQETEAKKKAEEAVASAETAAAGKRSSLLAAEAKLSVLQANSAAGATPEKILEARVAVAELQAELAVAEQAVVDVQADLGAFDKPLADGQKQAHGPVLLRVNMDVDGGVSLEPVDLKLVDGAAPASKYQGVFRSSTTPKKSKAKTPPPTLYSIGALEVAPDKQGVRALVFEANQPFESIESWDLLDSSGNPVRDDYTVTLSRESGTKVIAGFPGALPNGTYSLEVVLEFEKAGSVPTQLRKIK